MQKVSLNTVLTTILVIALALVETESATAASFVCTVETHHEVDDAGHLVQAESPIYIGGQFSVATDTGEIIGQPAGNQTVPNRKVQIISPGKGGMSASILTTRGGDFGRLADLLVIRTWADTPDKPFTYFDANFGVFAGVCSGP